MRAAHRDRWTPLGRTGWAETDGSIATHEALALYAVTPTILRGLCDPPTGI